MILGYVCEGENLGGIKGRRFFLIWNVGPDFKQSLPHQIRYVENRMWSAEVEHHLYPTEGSPLYYVSSDSTHTLHFLRSNHPPVRAPMPFEFRAVLGRPGGAGRLDCRWSGELCIDLTRC